MPMRVQVPGGVPWGRSCASRAASSAGRAPLGALAGAGALEGHRRAQDGSDKATTAMAKLRNVTCIAPSRLGGLACLQVFLLCHIVTWPVYVLSQLAFAVRGEAGKGA